MHIYSERSESWQHSECEIKWRYVIVLSSLLWSLHFPLIGGSERETTCDSEIDGLIRYPGGNQSPLLTESWGGEELFFFFFFYVRGHFIVSIRRLRLIRADEWNRISKAKPRCFRAAENFPFRLHNTLTRVCLILAQRQDIITTPTARHQIADEIKLLTEEKCLALSLSLTLISPALCSREVYGYVSVQSESD